MEAPSSTQPVLALVAVPRPAEADRGNLFVRLTPRTAWRLASLLLLSPSDGDGSQDDIVEGSFQDVYDVDFLPLEIVIHQRGTRSLGGVENVDDGGITLYASYNGAAPSTHHACPSQPYGSANNEDIIELPLDLHPSLRSIFNSTSEPVSVSVRPLSNVPIGSRVTFEPLTVSDWEMIEMEAEVLEDGGLLNQITVVSPGQTFPLRFGGLLGSLESAAWIKVVDEDFGTLENQQMDPFDRQESDDSSFGSDSEFDSSIDSSTDDDVPFSSTVGAGRHRCLRLMAETEVAVIPKPRMPTKASIEEDEPDEHESDGETVYCPSIPLRVQPTCFDVSHAVSSAGESPPLANPPLGSVYVHPSTIMQLPGYQQCNEGHLGQKNGVKVELPPMVVTISKVSGPHSKYSLQHEADQERGNSCNVIVATIYASNCIHEGHIGMHNLLRYQLGVRPLADWVSVQVWSEACVTSSIDRVRNGKEKFKIVKVSTTKSSEKRPVLHPWKLPDGHRAARTAASDMVHSTCEYCREKNLSSDMLSASAASIGNHSHAAVFCSGSLIPFEYIRCIGMERSEQACADMFALKLDPIAAPRDDSLAGNDSAPPGLSRLLPIVATKDLKELLNHDMRIETEEIEDKTLIQTQDFLLSEVSTVGFSLAIESVKQSARVIIASTPIDEATPNIHLPDSMHKHAIMMAGEEGSGKTHLAMASASQLCLSDLFATVYLDCKKLQASSSSIQIILEEIQNSFEEAMHKQPSILVLDDLDTLIPNVESSDSNSDGSIQHHQLNPALVLQVKIIVDHLLLLSHHCHGQIGHNSSAQNGVILICTCHDQDSLSIRYQQSGVFHSSVEVPSFDSFQRARFFQNILFENTQVSSTDRIPHVIARLGKITDGFRPKDMSIVAKRLVHQDYLRKFNCQTPETESGLAQPGETQQSWLKKLEFDIASIIEGYAPLSQQLVDIDHISCSMDWASIGGLSKVKQSLHDVIIHPMKFKSVYDNAPMTLPTGLVLYGPPGNGKTFIVPLLAKKCKLNLISCRGPELLDRYIGASEAKVRQLFARAAAAAPAMIFFDEFDSLAPQRGSDHTGVTDRVVNQLLTLLDGAEKSKNASHIFIVAATSRPDKIDKALLRPGRLEKHVYVGYPESLLEWNSMFSSLLGTRIVDAELSCLVQAGDLFNSLCKDSGYAKDFSAADMKAVLDTAHLLCVHDILGTNNEEAHHGPAILSKCHILEALKRTRPSLLSKDRRMLQSIYSSFGKNDINEDSPDPRGRGLKTSLR